VVKKFLYTPLLLLWAVQAFAGTWGTGSFENDDALDWAQEFESRPSMAVVVSTLKRVNGTSYIEASDGAAVIAAAEVVAAAAGSPSKSLPVPLATWAAKQPKAEAVAQLPLARQAVARVARGDRSELRELWLGSKAAAWQAAVAELEARLTK
jgi:hypothetical protein